MELQSLVLTSQLFLKNKPFEVTLTNAYMTWKEVSQPKRRKGSGGVSNSFRVGFCLAKIFQRGKGFCSGTPFVPVSEIISVQKAKFRKDANDETKMNGFTVFYVERRRHHHWRCRSASFYSNDLLLCHQWVQSLGERISLLTCRPRHLLVYINPFAGKQHGKKIYEQKVAPLFTLASITTDVIVTEHANHARDHLCTEADLRKYDGVICVGGDGMFSEVMHGLIARINQDNTTENLIQCNFRIGIVPAGSTDCVCYATMGINDPVTSALHVIVGDSQPMDVCSVHHYNTFLKYSVSLLGYGFYGDILTDSEKYRWMGPARYDFSGFKKFLSHHYYEGTISYLPAVGTLGNPRDKNRCKAGCFICFNSGEQLSKEKHQRSDINDNDFEGEWKYANGKFLAINAAGMSCACPRSPKGLSPAAHLADGTTDLIIVRKCSRLNFLRHLLRHTNKDDQFNLSFVEVHRVKKFKFTPKHLENESSDIKDAGKKIFDRICQDHSACCSTPVNSNWNCDGEILDHAEIEVRVHCQLIKLFARGIEEEFTCEEITESCMV